jgi:hypothetical protein
MTVLDRILAADDLVGVLGRDVPVRLLNISGSGCLVESSARIEEGATGSLLVNLNGETYRDEVRVARCLQIQGAGATCQLGIAFLWMAPPTGRSLRRIAGRLRGPAAQRSVDVRLQIRPPM